MFVPYSMRELDLSSKVSVSQLLPGIIEDARWGAASCSRPGSLSDKVRVPNTGRME